MLIKFIAMFVPLLFSSLMHVGSEIFDRARSCFVHLETVILFMLRVITRPRFARSMAAYYRGSNYKRGGK